MDISTKHNITFSVEQINKIYRVFVEISRILPQVNGNRKRMISINFILRKVLRMMRLPYKNIQTSRSKKTLASYGSTSYC